MNELALFAGAGGGILGSHLLGWRTVAAVEIEDYPRRVLLQRQADGILPRFPVWDDVCTFDGKPWRGKIDIITGGFPCQDISAAGKGAGITGERSGLWKEFARIIGEVRPRYAFIENSPMLVTRGLDVVLSDLASMGFDAEWGVISAADVGAPHLRERIWILAQQRNIFSHTEHGRTGWWKQQPKGSQEAYGETDKMRLQRDDSKLEIQNKRNSIQSINERAEHWRSNLSKPYFLRKLNGVANSVDRIKAIGNGQVPLAMATAFRLLFERLTKQ